MLCNDRLHINKVRQRTPSGVVLWHKGLTGVVIWFIWFYYAAWLVGMPAMVHAVLLRIT